MATFTKPTLVPRWADVGGNIAAAPEGLKDVGWGNNQEPPAGIQNEWQNLVGEWFKWLNERLDDGMSPDEVALLAPADASQAIKFNEQGARILRGLAVGFDQNPPPGGIAFGDAQANLTNDGTLVRLEFDTGDHIEFDRSNNLLRFTVAGTLLFTLTAAGTNFMAPLGVSSIAADNATVGVNLNVIGTSNLQGNTTGTTATFSDVTVDSLSGLSVSTSEADIHHGIRIRSLPVSGLDSTSVSGVASGTDIPSVVLDGTTDEILVPVPLIDGDRLLAIRLWVTDPQGAIVLAHRAWTPAIGVAPVATVVNTGATTGTGSLESVQLSGLNHVVTGLEIHNLYIRYNVAGGGVLPANLYSVQMIYDRP